MDYRKERFRKRLKDFEKSNNSVIVAAVLICIIIVASCVLIAQLVSKNNYERHTKLVSEQTPLPVHDTADDAENSENAEALSLPEPTQKSEEVLEKNDDTRGSKEDIPDGIRAIMAGISMPEDATVGYDDLSYLSIPYIDFDGKRQMGHMVVDKELADDVLDIFSELYEIGYPIERMDIIDNYNNRQTEELDSLDRASMGNNNTSAFCYRVVSGSDNLSNHAYGRAIDLNPKTNPYVSTDGSVSPRNAVKYADRSMENWSDIEKKAFIGPDTEVYRIFTEHGWEWGGEIWSYKDYQHFQKPKD